MKLGTVVGYHHAHAVGVVCSGPRKVTGGGRSLVDVRLFRDKPSGPSDDAVDNPIAGLGVNGEGAVEPEPTVPAYHRALAYAATLGDPLVWDEALGRAVTPTEFEANVARRSPRPRAEEGFAYPNANFCGTCGKWTGSDIATWAPGAPECGGDFRPDCPSGWKRFHGEVVTIHGNLMRVTPDK